MKVGNYLPAATTYYPASIWQSLFPTHERYI